MKKIVCIALVAFGFTANAQNPDTVSVFTDNQVIKTAYESETLTLKEKIAVVNEQVEEGNITENQAYQVISKMMKQEEADFSEEITDDYEYDWSKEENPFDFAMGVEVDTVVRYKKSVKPYLAFGLGNVAIDGAFANSEFGYLRSNFVEWGIAVRVPFNQYNNKWGIRYGLGFKYNGLATTQNQEFTLNGNETITAPSGEDLKNNTAYFRNTYITIPISLDFTTTSKTYNAANRKFDTKSGFNFGIGGYIGYNINSNQHLRYENADGYKIYEKQKGNWNVTNFQYGVAAYAGIDQLKIVFKYDLNPVFKNNPNDQNYWSLGLQVGL